MNNENYNLYFYQDDKLSVLNLKNYKIKIYKRNDSGFEDKYRLEIINNYDISMNSEFLNFMDFEVKVDKVQLFDNHNNKILYDMVADNYIKVNLANNDAYNLHQLIYLEIKEIK